ncbi:MAG TPA: methyl-accepting chemotaxis protein, partial [Bradyrhizobium sp.]|nr:methyl-accepting chemotaxis protein [Bradyrhizobium sp.]
MSFLARFRILTKIIAVVLLLSAVTISISLLGIRALALLNDGADNMRAAAAQALQGARANQNVIALNRAEFRVALDPSPENRAEVRKVIDEQMKAYLAGMEEVNKTSDDKVRAMMPAVNETMAEYKRDIENTLRIADEMKDTRLSDESTKLRDSVMKSGAAAEKLRLTIRGVTSRLNERVANFATAATAEYETTSRMLVILSIAGVAIGLVVGFMVGQYGVAKPINQLKLVMETLAGNDLTAEIPGTKRRDEVGDMARTVEVFKKNGLEVEHLKAEQQESERHAAERRKADMNKLADDFESAVGEIVETVSSASTELEASASTLTSSAERAQELATMVAAASEEASTNVQSVASATEELTSSVNEISRQVQESARMANEAVDQARQTNERVSELSKAAGRIGDVVELIN